MFKNFLPKYLFFIIFIIIGTTWYLIPKKSPCDTPITYRLGSFDERFNVSKQEFLDDINTSTLIWEKSIDKNLFEYNPNGKLVINLKYDDRQRTTQKNELLRADINKINQLAKSVKEEYTTIQRDTAKVKEEYQNQLNQYKQNQQYYNSQVDYWNSQGGAPQKEYDALVAYREALSSEWNALESKRLEVNQMIEKTNLFINKYNLLVENVNTNIDTINQTAGKEFEEGVYDPNTNQIDIYEFSSDKKLIRVLTHELGHALNLPHNENKESIMYSLNIGNTTIPSKEDIGSLQVICIK